MNDADIDNLKEAVLFTRSRHSAYYRYYGKTSSSKIRTDKFLDLLNQLGIDYSHWTGRRGSTPRLKPIQRSNEDIFKVGTVKVPFLRRYVLSRNLISEICLSCGLGTKWNGQTLSLQLDHINGINTDNRLENLRFLCPNCHTQASTWGTKNLKRKLPDDEKLLELAKTMTLTEIGHLYKVSQSHVSRTLSPYWKRV